MEVSTYFRAASSQQMHHCGKNVSYFEEIQRSPKQRIFFITVSAAAKSGNFSLNSILNKCKKCGGQGSVECPGCKGTGKNKKNGNIFERWKCFDCQGFGLKSCPVCGKGGLTPEQRGER